MTGNQIEYLKHRETQRNNRETLKEQKRHSLVTEAETERSHKTDEFERNRHNLIDESIRSQANAETGRHNLVTESQGQATLDETKRNHLVLEGIQKQQAETQAGSLQEQIRSNMEKEANTRLDIATKAATSREAARSSAAASRYSADVGASASRYAADSNRSAQKYSADISRKNTRETNKVKVKLTRFEKIVEEALQSDRLNSNEKIKEMENQTKLIENTTRKIIEDNKLSAQQERDYRNWLAELYKAAQHGNESYLGILKNPPTSIGNLFDK